MIDANKIKRFWDERGRRYGDRPSEDQANLEPDPNLLDLKVRLEKEAILPRLPLAGNADVLDLGAGYGQWAFRFAPLVRSVTAVEYSEPMLDSGRAEASRRGIDNVAFVRCAAESYAPRRQFDLVFISGLFMYLNDKQAEAVADMAAAAVNPGGKLFLRESASMLQERYMIEERYSKAADALYSALYRLPEEFTRMFASRGLDLLEEGNLFADGCPLNKWRETRLRFYLFGRPGENRGKLE